MIYSIWYPSGGFGHFVNACLLLKGVGFERPTSEFRFGEDGNSHSLSSTLPKYLHNPKEYPIIQDSTEIKKTVLIDNGIHDESKIFQKHFLDATVIKICYDDWSWSIVAKTMIEKAMGCKLDQEISVNLDLWGSNEEWEQREKYYLYLRDHNFRNCWREDKNCKNIKINDLLSFENFMNKFKSIRIEFQNDVSDLWKDWVRANLDYINPFCAASNIVDNLHKNEPINKTDLWTEAVVNYFIWLRYNFEVPAWDYRNWFSSTKDIRTMLESNGVKI